MGNWRRNRGNNAEAVVLRAAEQQGWRCLERNFNSRMGEIDLVLASAQELVIVEVRYRGTDAYGSATATVTPRKQARIIAATRWYLAKHPIYADYPIRFDVVGVTPDGALDWIEDAFQVE